MEDWNLISSGNKTKILQCENTTISTLHVLIPEGLLRRCPWFESSCGRALCTYLATAILSKQHQRLQKAGEDFHFSVLMGGFSPWHCDTLFHLHAMIPALNSALCHDLEGRKETEEKTTNPIKNTQNLFLWKSHLWQTNKQTKSKVSMTNTLGPSM